MIVMVGIICFWLGLLFAGLVMSAKTLPVHRQGSKPEVTLLVDGDKITNPVLKELIRDHLRQGTL